MKKKIIDFVRKNGFESKLIELYFKTIRYIPMRNIEFNKHAFKEITFCKGINDEYEEIPKIIWMFWADLVLPQEIAICIERIKKINPTYKVNLLNKFSVSSYIDINLIREDMPMANISDLIRLKLLAKYGGVWLDASIIMNQPIDYFLGSNSKAYDLIAFNRDKTTTNYLFPVLESWLLIAPKNSKYIETWLKNFILVEKIGSANYYKTLSQRPDFNEIKQGIEPAEYLIVYLANQITMKEIECCNIKLFLSDQSAYILQDTLGWRGYKTHAYLAILDSPKLLSPLYKLTSGDRKYMKIIFEKKLLNPKSILGTLIEKEK